MNYLIFLGVSCPADVAFFIWKPVVSCATTTVFIPFIGPTAFIGPWLMPFPYGRLRTAVRTLRCAVVPIKSRFEETIFDADCGLFSALVLSEDGAFVSALGIWKFSLPRCNGPPCWVPLDTCLEASVAPDIESLNCAVEELANPG